MHTEAHFEITAYAADGERLSLDSDRSAPDELTADNLWEAIRLFTSVPTLGYQHWDDGETERMTIRTVVLRHAQRTHGARGKVTFQLNELERITR